MAITINNNDYSSSFTANQLQQGNRTLNQHLERISTGNRINNAADDAAGLTIANGLASQARGLGQSVRNANDALSITQIADGAMQEAGKLVQNIRENALQAANASQSQESRQALQSEIDRSLEQLDNIAANTSYNNQDLLNGSFTGQSFQIGPESGNNIDIHINSTETGQLGSGENGSLAEIDVTTPQGAEIAVRVADEALTQLNSNRSNLGSTQNQLNSTISNLATTEINTRSAESNIRDVDLAEEAMNFNQMQVLNQARTFAQNQAQAVNQQNVVNLLQGGW
ncbi:MAG: flagellin [Thermodesulfobacteriota bacterium]